MVRLAEDMLEAGAGAWDAEEFAGHLATLAVAVAESAESESRKPDESASPSGDDGSSSGGGAPGVGDAARLAATLLLAGRDDARRAAADALTDALVAPAPAHPPRDYARALRPDGSDSDEAPHSSSGNDSASAVFFSSALASAARDGTRTADRLDRASQDTISTRFSCDACGASPILRRRWHCALCADYDECDACQARARGESLGAAVPPETRFHPTHDATHPMIPFECVTDGREREGIHVAGFETYAGEENGVERARAWRRPTSALDDDVLSREKPSDGKVALARALAVASADDAALGQTRGIRELAPFFVLLRRLAAVPEYAAAMAPAALAGARESAAAAAESLSAPRGSATARSAAADEKALLRLAFLSRVLGGTRGSVSLNEIRDVASVANGQTPPLLDSLRVVAEASRARDAARGVSASGMGEKGARRRKTNHGGDALQDALQDARDALDPLDTSLPKRQRNVDETKKTASRGVGDVRVRFGDPRFATSAEAFGDEPAAHANVADAADALGACLGFGAALDPIPPFAPAGSRALHEAHIPVVRNESVRESRKDLANLGESDLFGARLFELAAGLVARLAEMSPLGSDSAGSTSALSLIHI